MTQDELLLRQQALLLRSTQLRLALTQQTQVFKKPLAVADRARDLLRLLANKPAWPLATALLLVAWRPSRAFLWGRRLWWAYRSYRQARHWIASQR
jgi:hypothetical protein